MTTRTNGTFKNLVATVYQDWNVGGLAIRTAGSSDPTLKVWGTVYRLWAFSPTVLNQAFFTQELFHEWKPGTTVYPHIHWLQDAPGTGDVRWQLDWRYVKVNQVSSGTSTLDLTSAAGGSVDQHNVFQNVNGIYLSDFDVGGQIICRLYRDAANVADTFAGDALLLAFGFHFETDREGTSTMFGPYDT